MALRAPRRSSTYHGVESVSSRLAVVPSRAVDDARVSAPALRVLLALGSYTDSDGWCFPKQSTISDRLRLSRQTVCGHVRDLVALGYVEVARSTGRGLRYRIVLDLPPASEVSAQPTSGVGPADIRCRVGPTSEGADRSFKNDPKNASPDDSEEPPAPLEAHQFWSNGHGKILARLRTAGVPDELLDGAYCSTLDALTDGSEVFWDDELIKYQMWWADQPKSGRHRARCRGFDRWLAKALASDRARLRREASYARPGR